MNPPSPFPARCSPDCLLPDLIKAFTEGRAPALRFPGAVRSWQHMLDCLNGHLVLADVLPVGRGFGERNFGPGRGSFEVGTVATLASRLWGDAKPWTSDTDPHSHEANLLALDAAKAERELGRRNRLDFFESITWTVESARRLRAGDDPALVTLEQIGTFAGHP